MYLADLFRRLCLWWSLSVLLIAVGIVLFREPALDVLPY